MALVHQNGFRLTNRRPGRGSCHLVWLHFPTRKTQNKTERVVNKIRARRETTNATTPAEPQLFLARSQPLWAAGLHLQKAEAGPGVRKCVPSPACPRARLLTTFSIIAAPMSQQHFWTLIFFWLLKIAFLHKYKTAKGDRGHVNHFTFDRRRGKKRPAEGGAESWEVWGWLDIDPDALTQPAEWAHLWKEKI